jgi:MazG family protein
VKKDLISEISELVRIIGILRSPEGCPWDRQQNKEDVGKYLIDEAYEVIDAIDEGVADHLKEELGDLLFLIFFLAHMAKENGEFDMADVVGDVSEKMIRRHPHVFGDKTADNVEEVRRTWQAVKQEEQKGKKQKNADTIGNVSGSLPSLLQAFRITEQASDFGFDWNSTKEVMDKLEEETAELKKALMKGNSEQIRDEIGDVFFSLVNLSRFVKVNPEFAMKAAIKKFIRRFSFVENTLRDEGMSISEASMEEMDRLWNISKEKERKK